MKSAVLSYDVWSLNSIRRHLNTGQRAAIAVEMLPLLEEEARARQVAVIAKQPRDDRGRVQPLTQKIEQPARNESTAAAAVAQITGTNRQYVSDAKRLKQDAPELFEKVKSEISKIDARTGNWREKLSMEIPQTDARTVTRKGTTYHRRYRAARPNRWVRWVGRWVCFFLTHLKKHLYSNELGMQGGSGGSICQTPVHAHARPSMGPN